MKNYEKTIAKCYSTWGETYYDEYYGADAPYPPIHKNIIKDFIVNSKAKNLLDAGCGPASFLREVIGESIDLYGFDLTPEMVKEGKRIFREAGISDRQLWEGSVLELNDFKHPISRQLNAFDACVCVGVLPHIALEDENQVITNLKHAVKPGGKVMLEARNQLFALFTLNRYSKDFFYNDLIKFDDLKDKAGKNRAQIDKLSDQMGRHFQLDEPPIRKGKKDEPGYDEVLSRTHNPFELKQKFEAEGFEDVQVLFYHYHCMPPLLGKQVNEFFIQESLNMEDPTDWRGYFMASAFFVVGTRPNH